MLLDWHPVAFSLGPLSVRWYGLMYLVAFAAFWGFGLLHARRAHTPLQPEDVSDLLFAGAIGGVLGGRLGSALFYHFDYFIADPLMVLRIWEGGMSFHGGLIGVLVAVWLWQRARAVSWLESLDFAAPLVPLGLFTGRIGNFINGELWGTPTSLPWAVVFPHAGPEPRHPSQLYEATLEGLLLFAILWWFARTPRAAGHVAGLFAVGYSVVRFAVEFVRLPDPQLGYLAFGWLTMGQVLCLPLALVGLVLLWRTPPAPRPA